MASRRISLRDFLSATVYPLNLQHFYFEAAKDVADPLRAAPSLRIDANWTTNRRTCPWNSRKRKLQKILKNTDDLCDKCCPTLCHKFWGRIGSIAERDQWGISWFGCSLAMHCDPFWCLVLCWSESCHTKSHFESLRRCSTKSKRWSFKLRRKIKRLQRPKCCLSLIMLSSYVKWR